MKFSLIPRNYVFYDLFDEGASKLVQAGDALADLMQHFENVEMKTNHIKELEHDADDVTHKLYLELHQTFVTPLDREDIASLAQRMDDIMDYIEDAAASIRIYEVVQPTEEAKSLADLIRLQCIQISQAVANLRTTAGLQKVREQIVEIHRLENEADTMYLSASAQLFRNGMEPKDIIKWRDIYDQLERATDSAEQVAHVLEGIVIKHA